MDQTTDATKVRYGRAEALELARSAEVLVVARRKSVVVFNDPQTIDDDTLAAHILGPTGNLKAPTVRKGNTLYVGFSEEVYQRLVDT